MKIVANETVSLDYFIGEWLNLNPGPPSPKNRNSLSLYKYGTLGGWVNFLFLRGKGRGLMALADEYMCVWRAGVRVTV